MKNLFLIIIAIFAAIAFTGCGAKNIAYEKYSIERDLNQDIDKISGKSVKLIDSSEEKMIRKMGLAVKGSYSPILSFELDAANINKEISKEFINQYFNQDQKAEECFIINSKITDYLISRSLNPSNMNVELEMNFIVIKNGVQILNKTYKKEVSGTVIWEWRLTLDETTYRKLQKGVLSIYQNEFKKDLIEALRKNS